MVLTNESETDLSWKVEREFHQTVDSFQSDCKYGKDLIKNMICNK